MVGEPVERHVQEIGAVICRVVVLLEIYPNGSILENGNRRVGRTGSAKRLLHIPGLTFVVAEEERYVLSFGSVVGNRVQNAVLVIAVECRGISDDVAVAVTTYS